MDFLESLFYMIWRGLAIGILISAPMGPVGILCIQRTLNRGRRTGFYTGVGAALSDLFYCLLTGFGLSFIEDFIERNQNVIQLIGSAVLIGFGVYLFKKNPAMQLKRPVEQAVSPKKNILTGFLFTFSNPLILFLIIGLFARFNFAMPNMKFYHYILGFISIIAGALGWWWVVTYFIDKVRAHFNLRSMWLVNRIIGAVIMLFAIVGIVTGVTNLVNAAEIPAPPAKYWNSVRGYSAFKRGGKNGLHLLTQNHDAVSDTCFVENIPHDFTLTFRETHNGGENGWSFFIGGERGEWVHVNIKALEHHDGFSSMAGLQIAVVDDKGNRKSKTVTSGVDFYKGENIWSVAVDKGVAAVFCGDHGLVKTLEFPLPGFVMTSFGFSANKDTDLLVTDIILDGGASVASPEYADPMLLAQLADSSDPLEGYWRVLDYTLDESLLRSGGDYTLAIMRKGGQYGLYYLEGAEKNASQWERGRLKGLLIPDGPTGVFRLIWIDAESREMRRNLKAQFDPDGVITLHFPLQSSSIRLAKLPG